MREEEIELTLEEEAVLREAIRQADRGELIPWEEVRKKLRETEGTTPPLSQ